MKHITFAQMSGLIKHMLKYLLITVLMLAIAACGMGKGCDCPKFGLQLTYNLPHGA